MVTLGDLYKMWENERSKKLAQTMSWALEGQMQDNWQEIMSERNNWDEDEQKQKFVQMLQNLGTKTFDPKALKQQCKVMENRNIKIPEQSLHIGTYRLIQINQLMPYLGIYARPYTMKELNKIIGKSLLAKALQKYVRDGDDDLENITNIWTSCWSSKQSCN